MIGVLSVSFVDCVVLVRGRSDGRAEVAVVGIAGAPGGAGGAGGAAGAAGTSCSSMVSSCCLSMELMSPSVCSPIRGSGAICGVRVDGPEFPDGRGRVGADGGAGGS